jgi:CHAT domain-containing protein/Tfp pilus assembly protein PilF
MRGRRKQRHHHGLKVLALAVLLAVGCNRNTDDDQRYADAIAAIRRGNFKLAQALAEQGNAAWNNAPQSSWHWKYRLVLAEALLNVGRAKDAPALLDPQPSPDLSSPEVTCRYKTVLAKAFFRLGQASEAGASLDQAETCAQSLKLSGLAPENQMVRYVVFEASNQPDKAEEALQLALRFAQEQKDTYWQAIAYNNLGYRRIRSFRYDEALPFLTEAETRFLSLNSELLASGAESNIALCASRLGEFEKALAMYNRAIEIQQREGLKPFLQGSLGEVGNIYALQDEPTKAVPYHERALLLAMEINNFSDASKWAVDLADEMAQLGSWTEAEKFNEQSRELKGRVHDNSSLLHIDFHEGTIAAGRGDNENAEKLFLQAISAATNEPAVLWEAHYSLAQLYRRTGNHRKSIEQFEAAIRVIETSQSALTLPDYKITFLARLISFYQAYVDALVERGDYDKALQVAESSRARVLAERISAKTPERIFSTASVYSEAARQSKSVFLSYWLAPRRSFLWVIRADGRHLFILPPAKEIQANVDAYLAFVQNLRDPLEGSQAGDALYTALLAPAQKLIPAGANVVIVPDGALHNLNLETLRVPGATPHYWIEDAVVSVAPSLMIKGDLATHRDLKSILLIGNPESASPDFPKLPNAADEITNVRKRFALLQNAVYEGPNANPKTYRAANPGSFSAIHFAAHASANASSPMESAIILSSIDNSFKLYARDVAQIPLQADLVTISACRGAGARIYSGEGMVGFTWAFLQAGARQVIAGLWDVTDSSTVRIMDRLYEDLSSRKTAAEALREAKLSLIHSPGNFHKPYYWGPFQLYVGFGHR